MRDSNRLLTVDNLKVSFFTSHGENQAVRDVSFHLDEGETLGIVGESGSGKSVTAKSILSLIQPPGEILSGDIVYKDQSLLKLSEKQWQKIRGNRIAMVFQDPMTSLNPVKTIGYQMSEIIRRHRGLSKQEARKESANMLAKVGITDPERRLDQYPHEFSGGMRQRVMIAMALSCQPELLIADEPTTALDVTIQAQILDLIEDIKDKTNTSVILITHDLGVVAQVCTRVIVMYGGRIMEEAAVEDLYRNPSHPYTQGLLQSLPARVSSVNERLMPIEGSPPTLIDPPSGCPFRDRCKHAFERCHERPPMFQVGEGHYSACWLLDKQD